MLTTTKTEPALEGKKFNLENNSILIKKRKNPQGKPLFYLFNLSKHSYLSSLYPTKTGGFLFDTWQKATGQKKHYFLNLDSKGLRIVEAQLEPKNKNTNAYV